MNDNDIKVDEEKWPIFDYIADQKKFILERLSRRELLEQLAEEASELSQAALKCIRAEGFTNNVTPVISKDALHNLYEEYRDVDLVYAVLMDYPVHPLSYSKLERWAHRLGYKKDLRRRRK